MSSHPYASSSHQPQHPYATASRASPRPPPSATSSSSSTTAAAAAAQAKESSRRRSTSLPYHSHAPLGPPSAPPRIPLPEVPREPAFSIGLDDWPSRSSIGSTPPSLTAGQSQSLGVGIVQAPPLISHSRSLPGTAGTESRFPTLLEDSEDGEGDSDPVRARRTRTSTDSGRSEPTSGHSYSSSLSRPSSRASGRITPLPSGVMRRLSNTGRTRSSQDPPTVAPSGVGQRSRSKSRSRGQSDADGSNYGSPLMPAVALDPPTPEERERLRVLERDREREQEKLKTRQPSRASRMMAAPFSFIGGLNAHPPSASVGHHSHIGSSPGLAHTHTHTSSNPVNSPPPMVRESSFSERPGVGPSGAGGGVWKGPGVGPPSPSRPVRNSPSLPQFPQVQLVHAFGQPAVLAGGSGAAAAAVGEEWADPTVTLRRKMSAPRVDTSSAALSLNTNLNFGNLNLGSPAHGPGQALQQPGLTRRPSTGLLGLSGRDVAIMAPGVVEGGGHGRARSNSKATLSGRDTPGSLTKLLPDPFPLAPSPNDGTAEHPYHIAVFGGKRCGKTTFITLGLENWWHIKRVAEVVDKDGVVRYQSRSSKIRMATSEPSQAGPEVHYRILEVDSKQVDWEEEERVWPAWMPYIDGAFVLFDSSSHRNGYVSPAVDLIRDLNIPCVVVATKTDQPEAIPLSAMDQRTRTRDVGLVGSSSEPGHKNRVAPKHCFRYLCKVVTGGDLRDPRGPTIMTPISSTPVTPIIQSLTAPSRPPSPVKPAAAANLAVQGETEQIDRMATPTPTPMAPAPLLPPKEEDPEMLEQQMPSSPTTRQRPRSQSVTNSAPQVRTSYTASLSTNNLLDLSKDLQMDQKDEMEDEKKDEETEVETVVKLPPSYMYTTLEGLCERVFFMAISDSDLTFLYHFFLTYRKFTTARFVLREWKKYWDSLDDPKINENMRMFGKLGLAHLILDWVVNFPQDFTAEGSYQALRATHKLMAKEDNTLFHATQLKILINKIDRSEDPDRSWTSREVDSDEESVEENDRLMPRSNSQRKITPTSTPRGSSFALSPSFATDLSTISGGRSRTGVRKKPSLTPGPFERRQSSDDKQLLKDLAKVGTYVERLTPIQVAREIMRLELPLFMDIEPREWPRHLWTPAKERPYPDPIDCMAVHFMRVQTWVSSLILAKEGQNARSSIIAKFCLVAHELRRLNDFNSLRAVHVGIKDALPPTQEILQAYFNNQQILNMFHYHDLLFGSDRNYIMYHRTLLHTPFFAIPCFEIHTSTLLRSDRNLEWHPDEPHLLHWGKFAVFGKIVDQVTRFQERIPPTLPEDPAITKSFHGWFVKQTLMPRALMEKRRAVDHFIDKSTYSKAKDFLLKGSRLDSGLSDATISATAPTPLFG